MEPTTQKKRIEYIDLMKGVCITLVVLLHVIWTFNIDIVDNVLSNIRMPLYFFLSGLFFKKYSNFKEFAIKKTNKLIIPYLFFCLIPYCLLAPFFNEAYKTSTFTVDFTNLSFYGLAIATPYNGPLWFLRCLFMTNIFYYIFKIFTDRYSRIVQIVILICIVTLVALTSDIIKNFLIINGNTLLSHFVLNTFLAPFVAMPFLYGAEWVRRVGLLNKDFNLKKQMLIFILSVVIWILFAQPLVHFESASPGLIFPFMYVSAFAGITALAIVCKRIKKLFFFSYIGRYSLIVLGTHWPFIFALQGFFELRQSIQFIIVLAIMPPTIWLFKTLFPYFTAQKDIFTYKQALH